MTYKEYIELMSQKTGLKKAEVERFLTQQAAVIFEALQSGCKFVLHPDVGYFKAADVARRAARNPQTGEEIVVKAHKSPKFKAAKALKEAVR